MTERITSPEHFTPIEIVLNSERFSAPIILYSSGSSGSVVEYNIYEDITKPYLSGNIIFLDDNDLYQLADLNGTEKLTIRYELATGESEAIEKTFYITSIENPVKINDYSSMIKMNFIQDIGWYNNLISNSRSYQGKGEEIINTLVTQDLHAGLTQKGIQSHQTAFRYINPYLTPLEAVKNILLKITTPLGLPYFLYSSLGSDELVLKDMQTILNTAPFNAGNPFTYSQATTNEPTGSIENQLATIYNYEGGILENTLQMLIDGGVGSSYNNLNITTGKIDGQRVDITSTIRALVDQSVVDVNHSVPLVDLEFIADPSGNDSRKLNEFDPKEYYQISSDNFPYDTDLNSYSSESNFSDYSMRAIRNGILVNLTKNMYTIYVPGMLFSTKNESTSVGNQIEVRVLKNDPSIETGAVDHKRSGNYIILAKRHKFDVVATTHNVSMQIGRITNAQVQR